MAIPKTLNFIWLGDKPLPDKYVNNIKNWMRKNPDFQVNLWVDSVKTSKDIIEGYQNKPEFFNREYLSTQFQVKDAASLNLIPPQARYEIDRLMPNYGAASDLIRYSILNRYGGGYLDCDVLPPEEGLSEHSDIWDQENNEAYLYAVKISLLGGSPSYPNDVLFCAPNNKILTNFSQMIEKRYQNASLPCDTVNKKKTYSWVDFSQLSALLYQENRAQLTVYRSGPQGLIDVVNQNSAALKPYLINIEEKKYRVPLDDTGSDASWDILQPKPFDDLEQALEVIRKEISFQLSEHGNGILPLVDLNNLLIQSLELTSNTPEQITKAFLQELERFDLKKAKAIQMPLYDHEIARFCRANQLLSKSYFFPTQEMTTDEVEEIKQVIDSFISTPFDKEKGFDVNLSSLLDYYEYHFKDNPVEQPKAFLKILDYVKYEITEGKKRAESGFNRLPELKTIKWMLGKNLVRSLGLFHVRNKVEREAKNLAIELKEKINNQTSLDGIHNVLFDKDLNESSLPAELWNNLNTAREKFNRETRPMHLTLGTPRSCIVRKTNFCKLEERLNEFKKNVEKKIQLENKHDFEEECSSSISYKK